MERVSIGESSVERYTYLIYTWRVSVWLVWLNIISLTLPRARGSNAATLMCIPGIYMHTVLSPINQSWFFNPKGSTNNHQCKLGWFFLCCTVLYFNGDQELYLRPMYRKIQLGLIFASNTMVPGTVYPGGTSNRSVTSQMGRVFWYDTWWRSTRYQGSTPSYLLKGPVISELCALYTKNST